MYPTDYALVLPWYPKVASEQLHHHGWRPSWHRVVTLAIQLASALEHVHQHDIVHRYVLFLCFYMALYGFVRFC